MFKWFKPKEIDYDFCYNLKEKDYPKYLMEIYKQKMGYKFDLKHPKTLNEIIQYLKIYDNTPIKQELTDKTIAYKKVEEILNTTKYSKEIIGIYDSIMDVNFDELPQRFIIKLNNASKKNVSIYNKDLFTEDKKQIVREYFLTEQEINYAFHLGFELQYKNIKPKIIVERLYPFVTEYQILCTKGKPILISFLDEKSKIYNKIYHFDKNEKIIEDINVKFQISEIVDIAKELSKQFKLVRIDFMVVKDTYIFFQEYTFTPYSGITFIPEYNSSEYGRLIDIK